MTQEVMNKVRVSRYASPAGELLLGCMGDALCACVWSREGLERVCRRLEARWEEKPSEVAAIAAAQLDEYFAGERWDFTVPVGLEGTAFQRRVWTELTRIPYGQTVSYGALAARLGTPSACRAAAGAVGANPVSIIVPCHRVIASCGALGGYAGGHEAKIALLGLEREATRTQSFMN